MPIYVPKCEWNEGKRTELEPNLCANRQEDGRARTHQAAERAPYLGNVPRRDVDAERKGDGRRTVGVVPVPLLPGIPSEGLTFLSTININKGLTKEALLIGKRCQLRGGNSARYHL
ncbi:hypothetical protein BJ912DRAFT_936601 [Pholiota molesta]|nr:hypothetical protein BJ912DRAFT_936601 [Pholiota molesta]